MKTHSRSLTRRGFLRNTAATFATVSVVPSYVLGLRGQTPPSEKLNVAGIGVGGQGAGDIQNIYRSGRANIVALCDVDSRHSSRTFSEFPKAKAFKDFRKMLDEIGQEIDAVMVATPDHTHAVAVVRAIKMGKHVYCEKPLARSIHEVRAIMKAAQEHKVVTQLGNQGHSFETIRTFCEWVWDGAIGAIREVHAFCNANYSRIHQLDQLKNTPPAPDTLDWDLWLGPTRFRPYNPVFLPGAWRGWSQFGTGVVGDWTCHVVDPVFWALDLGAPTSIVAEPVNYDPKKHFETFPPGTIIRYEFPAKGNRPAVKLTWFDGQQRPPEPEELGKDDKLPGIGAVVIGEKGKIVYGSHGASGVEILPESRMDEYKQKLPPKTIPRSPGHHREWVQACIEGKKCGSDFSYGGPLTEIALLGIIATRLAGTKLEWNSAQRKFTNAEANRYLEEPYRSGWTL